MKKIILLLTLTLCFAFGAFAQYEKGDITVNAGVSFGLIGYGYSYYSNSSGFPPLSFNAEYSINERFAVGPYVGLYSRSYNYGSGYKDKFTALSFGARGSFHASSFLNDALNFNIDEDKWDIYATLLLGVETYSWKTDERFGGINYYSNGSRVILGPVAGVRYHISPNLGVFFEGGRGAFGYGTLGVSGKF